MLLGMLKADFSVVKTVHSWDAGSSQIDSKEMFTIIVYSLYIINILDLHKTYKSHRQRRKKES